MEIQRPQPSTPLPEHAKLVFKGVLFDTYQWEQELFDGTTATFERLRRRDSAIVIPVTPEGTILITEQEQPIKGKFVGFAGGMIEPGEPVLEAAARELKEETGYEAERFELWKSFQTHNKIDWALYIFVAKGCRKVAEQNLDAGERITVKEITFEELLELAVQDGFDEPTLSIAVLKAKLDPVKMEELRALFRP